MPRAATPKLAGRFRRFRRAFLGRTSGFFAGVVALIIVLSTVGAPILSPYEPNRQELLNAYSPPSAEHWFGTDGLGRDVFSRVLHGGRTSLLLGLVAVGIAMLAGGLLGIVSGYVGGALDQGVSFVVDVLMAFPVVLLAIFIVGVFGTGTYNTSVAIGVGSMPIFVRVLRGEVMRVRNEQYVEAARALGASAPYIIAMHVARNVLAPLIVLATLRIGTAILAESGLSFLGLGVQIPDSSWGSMISDGKTLLRRAPWVALTPGIIITVTVLAFNMLGDSLRDFLDPRSR